MDEPEPEYDFDLVPVDFDPFVEEACAAQAAGVTAKSHPATAQSGLQIFKHGRR